MEEALGGRRGRLLRSDGGRGRDVVVVVVDLGAVGRVGAGGQLDDVG